VSLWDDPFTIWDEFFWDSPDLVHTAPRTKKKTNRRTMASNPTPDNNDILRALADRMADGCHTHEVSMGIKQNTEAVLVAATTALDTAETQVGMKKLGVDEAYAALEVADEAGSTTLTNCKLRLAQKLGQRWSAAWEPTGFPNQSTGVPKTQDERFTLLKDLKNYFAEVPANESAEMGATAAICNAAWTALSTARQGVADAEYAQTMAFEARTTAGDALRKRVRGLITELETLISDEDPRWEAFGLNIPANPTAPEPVASVTVTPATNHRLEVSWPYAVRATRYRIEKKVAGVDADFTNAASAKDLEVILKGFTAGQSVEVRVVATNDGGSAAPSPSATAVVS
jgi:hypothetical protein